MEIVVDLGKCQGYGNCVLTAPDVFDLDDKGKVVVLVDSGYDPVTTREGVRSCPAHALELIE